MTGTNDDLVFQRAIVSIVSDKLMLSGRPLQWPTSYGAYNEYNTRTMIVDNVMVYTAARLVN